MKRWTTIHLATAATGTFVGGVFLGTILPGTGDSVASSSGTYSTRNSIITGSSKSNHRSRSTLSPKDAFQAFSQAVSSRDEKALHEASPSLMAAVEFDPEGTLDRALEITDHRWRVRSLAGVYAAWLATDPATAEAQLTRITNPGERRGVLQSALTQLARRHPQLAFEVLNRHRYRNDQDIVSKLFSTWGTSENNRDTAVATLEEITSLTDRRHAIQGLAGAFGKSNPEEAFAWAQSLTAPDEQSRALLSVIDALAGQNPRKAIAYFENHPHLFKDSQSVGRLAHRWARDEPSAALQWARENLTGEQQTVALQQIAQLLPESDPVAAQKIAMELPSGRERERIMRKLGEQKGNDTPEAALAWVRGLDTTDQASALVGVVESLAGQAPQHAAAFLESADLDNKLQARLASDIVGTWKNHHPREAAQWAATLPEKMGEQALRDAIAGWSRHDPEAAMVFVAELPETESKQKLVRESTARMMKGDYSQAAAWLENFDEGQSRQTAVGDLATRWVRSDAMEASTWIASLKQGPSRDSAVVAMVDQIEKSDPNSAYAWAATISDPSLREQWQRRLQKRMSR